MLCQFEGISPRVMYKRQPKASERATHQTELLSNFGPSLFQLTSSEIDHHATTVRIKSPSTSPSTRHTTDDATHFKGHSAFESLHRIRHGAGHRDSGA